LLRISEISGKGGEIVLRLEGRLTGGRVEMVETLCRHHLGKGGKALVVDLAGVSYLDREGALMLGRVKEAGARLVNCSPFLRLLLRLHWGSGEKG